MENENDFTVKDRFGTAWDLKIDLADAKAIDASDYSSCCKTPFAFLSPEREFFGEVFANRGLAAALAWTIVQDQLAKLNVEHWEQRPKEELELLFLRRLDGSALRDLHRTILRALGDFFPEQQTVLSNLLVKMDLVNERLRTELEAMDGELDQILNEEMDKQISEVRSNLPKMFDEKAGRTFTSPLGKSIGTLT